MATPVATPGGAVVPGIPEDVLRIVSGEKGAVSRDAQIAAASVIDLLRKRGDVLFPAAESAWATAARSIFTYLQIRKRELPDVLAILAQRGYSKQFFSLALPRAGPELKNYLIENGALWDTVVQYHDFDTWDGLDFARGLVFGLGRSLVSILEGLRDLGGFAIELLTEFAQAKKQIANFFSAMWELTTGVLSDPLASASKAMEAGRSEWLSVNRQFSVALYDEDYYRAGFTLGKLAGDLWQVFEGVRMLSKLPGLAKTTARAFSSLFAVGARESARAVGLLSRLLGVIGPKVIKTAVSVGAGALIGFLEDSKVLVEGLRRGILLNIDHLGHLAIIIPSEMALEVPEGAAVVQAGVLLIADEGSGPRVLAAVRASPGRVQECLERHLKDLASRGRKMPQSPSMLEAAGHLEEVLVKELGSVQEHLREHLIFLCSEMGINLNFGTWGTYIHATLAEMLPSLRELGFATYSELTNRALFEGLGMVATRTRDPAITLANFAKKVRPDLAEEIEFLARNDHYWDPDLSIIGTHKTDAVLVDRANFRVFGVDWTSSLGERRFARALGALLKDTENVTDEALEALSREYLAHKRRELIVRQAVFEYLFEPDFSTATKEITYDVFGAIRKYRKKK